MSIFATVFTLLISITIYSFFKWYKLTRQFEEFPGPRPWIPLLGNTAFLAVKKKKDPKTALNEFLESLYERFKHEGMFFIFLGYRPVLYLHKPEFVNQVLKDNAAFNKSVRYDLFIPLVGNGLFTANGQRWKAKRKFLNQTFHFEILDKFIPVINDQIKIMIEQIDKISSSAHVDIRPFLCNLAIDIISATAMGLSLGVQIHGENEFVQCSNRSFNAIFDRIYNPILWNDFLFYRTKTGKQFRYDTEYVHNFTRDVIKKRKQNLKPGKSEGSKQKRLALLDLLIANQENDDSVTDNELREDVDTFMVAGNETTSTALSWVFLLLGNHIGVQQRMREELELIFGDDVEREVTREDLSKMIYTECVLKESMRLFPPAPIVARVSTKDIIVNGLKYPKGNTVFINILKLHLDEEAFPEPTKFDPERFLSGDLNKINAAFMPFAAGPRNCIGQRFAMLEMKLILAHVFRKYSIQCLNQVNEIEKTFDITMRPVNEIMVKFSS